MSGNQLLAGGVNPNTLSHTTDQGPTRKQSVEVWRSSNVKIESQSVQSHSCIHKNAPLKPTVTSKDISTWLITKNVKHCMYTIPINSEKTIQHSNSCNSLFLCEGQVPCGFNGFFLPNTVLWTPSYHIATTVLHSNDTSTQVCRSTGGDRKSSSTIWIPWILYQNLHN